MSRVGISLLTIYPVLIYNNLPHPFFNLQVFYSIVMVRIKELCVYIYMVCSYAIEDATCPIRSADATKYLETFCLHIGSRQPHPMLFTCGRIIARMQKV